MENSAVAAQFPDPAVRIDSPAFKGKATALTSQKDLESFVDGLASKPYPPQVIPLGKSQQGRSIPLLVFSKPASANPIVQAKNRKPTVLIIGQQHGNEPAGGEAALAFASELATDRNRHALLEKVNVLIVPRANPDGTFHFVRELANGADLNRDHLLLKTPEGKALAKIFTYYQPDIVLDCHEFTVGGRWIRKFGAVQKYDALIQYATTLNLPSAQTGVSELFRNDILKTLSAHGLSHSWYYTTNRHDLKPVVSMGGIVPDTARNAVGLRGAISFLLETRGVGLGLAHFKRRVWTHLLAIRAVCQTTALHADEIIDKLGKTQQSVIEEAGKGRITILGKPTVGKRVLEFLTPADGATKFVTVDWQSSLQIQPVLSRPRPFGYLLKASEVAAARRLTRLGVSVYCITTQAKLTGQGYELISVSNAQKEDVTGSVGKLKATVQDIRTRIVQTDIKVDPADFYIPLDQPLGNLIVAALEPESQSSLPANGFLAVADSLKHQYKRLPLFRMLQRPQLGMRLWTDMR